MTGQRFEDVYQNKVSSAVEYCGYLPHLASSHPPDQPAPSAVSSSQCLKPCWTFNVAFDVAGRASFTITYKYDSTREAKKCKRCVKCKRPYHTSDRSRHERNCVYLKQDALNQQASDAPRQPAPAPLLAALDQGSSGEITEEQPFCVTGGPPGPSQQKAIISPPFGPLHSPANGQSPQMPFLAPSGPPEGVVRQGAPGYVNNTCEQMPPEAGWEGATAFATAVFSDGDETEDMRLMDLDPPDVNAYDTLIEAYGRCERLDEALRLWRKMTNGREVEPVEPNNYTFKRTLDALADRFHKLVRSGVTPNPVQYMILIKGFAQIKQIDMALWLYRDMKRKGVPCNDVTYKTLIDACRLVSDMRQAVDILKDMNASLRHPLYWWTIDTYSAMIKGLCTQGNIDAALELFDSMWGRGIQPDTIIYNALLEECARRYNLHMTEQLLQNMIQSGVAPTSHTLTILVKLYGLAKEFDKAHSVVTELFRRFSIDLKYQDAHVWTAFMDACIANQRLPLAMEVSEKMLVAETKPNASAFGAIIVGCVEGAFSSVTDPNASHVEYSVNAIGFAQLALHYELKLEKFVWLKLKAMRESLMPPDKLIRHLDKLVADSKDGKHTP
mmetsp:Transcript_16659/g.47448  ORF Transcript_16659/g.47448 Transcript_16659/m.47448 type:complete len:611 (-) Transcript_16659:1624-3456(-)